MPIRTHYHTGRNTKTKDEILNNLDQYEWQYYRLQYQTALGQYLINLDPFLKFIHMQFPGKLRLFKLPSMSFYRWHTDHENLCNFNLIFSHQDCHTLFLDTDKLNSQKEDRAVFPVIRVEYIPGQWTLFNSQIKHAVYNFDKNDRYLLSYSVDTHSYNTVLDFIKPLS